MLYFQALFWILAATFTELPSVALGFMNINDPWNMMFQYPHLTLVVITSSRAYRDLFQYITSDQTSYPVRRGRRPRGMQATPQSGGRDVQVTVTKTIEFDVELRLGGGDRRAADEESEGYSSPLTEEEQQIRTLELQMKHDLEI